MRQGFSLLLAAWVLAWAAPEGARAAVPTTIGVSAQGSPCLQLAAREVRRYVFLRTGVALPIREKLNAGQNGIRLIIDRGLPAQAYRLQTTGDFAQGRILTLAGGSDVAVLYAAYQLAEKLGVRFYLHGDVVPDQRIPWILPNLNETHAPLFETRGILPFHDFTEGPDWWEADDYKACFQQLAKLRMNLLGLHCYPEGMPGPEPLVWIGHPDDVDAKGKVAFSSPSRWASTTYEGWGYMAVPTRAFAAGAGELFAEDDFGPSVTRGHRPQPKTPEACNEVFERTAGLLRDAFGYGRRLGVQICLGTEAPLHIPVSVAEHLRAKGLEPNSPAVRQKVYEGIFTRIARAYPIDYYWLWTPEDWTWRGASPAEIDATARDIQLALAALKQAGSPFRFGTCGWELGPKQNRGLFDQLLPRDAVMSCINRNIGFNWVDREFGRIKDRPKWAIPWMEDDSVMVLPQLWAGRVRRDAADAFAYGCTGLLGIHWRTQIIAPNVSALAQAAWSQQGWNPEAGKRVVVPAARTTELWIGGAARASAAPVGKTDEAPVYQTFRGGISAYRLSVPNGTYDVTLKFCEPFSEAAGQRVFGVSVEGQPLAERLDIFAVAGRNVACDLTAKAVRVVDEELNLDFKKIVGEPLVAGIAIAGHTADANQFKSVPYARRINCGGGKWGAYEADFADAGELPPPPERPRDLPCADFYDDMAAAWFGPEVAGALARFFARYDGDNGAYGVVQGRATLPRPTTWLYGPGAMVANPAPWEQEAKQYALADELAALRPRVRGAGNLARFDYWLNTFCYLRALAETQCARGALDAAMERVKAAPEAARQRELANAEALPARLNLSRAWEKMMTYLLAATETPGELGVLANLEQAARGKLKFVESHDPALAAALGEPLPEAAQVSTRYQGASRLIVPTVRSVVARNEKTTLKALVLDQEAPVSVVLAWRPLGRGPFSKKAFSHVARGVYQATLPVVPAEGLEYYVWVKTRAGRELVWPATAPALNGTLVVLP